MISRTFTNPILLGLLYVNYFAKKLSEVIFIGGHLELATILNHVIFEGGTISKTTGCLHKNRAVNRFDLSHT